MELGLEALGWVAMILVVLAFYFNTRKIFGTDSIGFPGMNALSGLLMSVNTWYHNAYPSMSANIIWMLIAETSLYKQINFSRR